MCGETGNGETPVDGLCPAIADSADGPDCHLVGWSGVGWGTTNTVGHMNFL